VPRLFAGTPWDRPAACDRCGRLESECACPPPVPEVKRMPPEQQTARLMTERRAKGKLVTVIAAPSFFDGIAQLGKRIA
jgi:translation initiation factor 1